VHRRLELHRRARIGLAAAGLLVASSEARADPPPKLDYTTPRFEPAGFPLISGNSDTGLQLGAVGTLSKFGAGIVPYQWNADLLLSLSIKTSPEGLEITQYGFKGNIDIPGLLDGSLRINPAYEFRRTINRGYFGIGNATSPDTPPVVAGDPNRYFQFKESQFQLRGVARFRVATAFELVPIVIYRFQTPSAYPGSKLEQDAAPGSGVPSAQRGLRSLNLFTVGGGFIHDTRDNEYFPISGQFYQVALKYIQGAPLDADVRYGQASASLVGYFPIRERITFASRVLLDLQFGNVPFFDLLTGGPFKMQDMPGGSAGIRGVPVGRYLGPIKMILNEELRSMWVDFHLFGQSFHFGSNVFFDTGRIFADYTFHAPEDGSGLGLKLGIGAGAYLQWGQAAVFRLEMAYSPDARSTSPSFPFGVYLEDGTMF
jgi:hypothetical protein